MAEKDSLYRDTLQAAGEFVFDERVVRVFPDMIKRSVPGYGLVLELLALLARRFVQENSTVYDLGCSLGAATLAVQQGVEQKGVRLVAVDSSAPMIARCRQLLDEHGKGFAVEFIQGDARQVPVHDASMTVLNFTLQFIPPADREGLLHRIREGTRGGGILVLSEKIRFDEPEQQEIQTDLHHDFKRSQGYSDLEIARKRNALEQVLRPDTEEEHLERLKAAGWRQAFRCFQALNFVCYLAIR